MQALRKETGNERKRKWKQSAKLGNENLTLVGNMETGMETKLMPTRKQAVLKGIACFLKTRTQYEKRKGNPHSLPVCQSFPT
jgi:hypothetical protein